MPRNKTAQAGYLYAEELVCSGEVAVAEVDIDEMVGSTNEMPDEDYCYLQREGVQNPNPHEYWAGYNEYMRNLIKRGA